MRDPRLTETAKRTHTADRPAADLGHASRSVGTAKCRVWSSTSSEQSGDERVEVVDRKARDLLGAAVAVRGPAERSGLAALVRARPVDNRLVLHRQLSCAQHSEGMRQKSRRNATAVTDRAEPRRA